MGGDPAPAAVELTLAVQDPDTYRFSPMEPGGPLPVVGLQGAMNAEIWARARGVCGILGIAGRLTRLDTGEAAEVPIGTGAHARCNTKGDPLPFAVYVPMTDLAAGGFLDGLDVTVELAATEDGVAVADAVAGAVLRRPGEVTGGTDTN
jgi:hypothetical protein